MPTSVLVIGDSYMPVEVMRPAVEALRPEIEPTYATVDPVARPYLPPLREYQGDPAVISTWIADHSAMVVHAAPVTRTLLEQHRQIRLVVCLRGGPVNVDLDAAAALDVAVVNTPAKNAPSVCDLTIAYLHLLLRRVPQASQSLVKLAEAGGRHLDSTFIGGQWTGREPRGLTIGIVGYGAIGRLVGRQARRLDMRVLVHDPFVTEHPTGVEMVGLGELSARSDVITLHAKATPETTRLVDAPFLASMKPGAVLINTSRESLVDETALLAALMSGSLAGAALDVCEPDGAWPELAMLSNVILSPHLGGATAQTQQRGLQLGLSELMRFVRGEQLQHRLA
ncbi:NAD(P)-dependent oxidoreductase [Microbacterium terrisoli]|uniref:NAD(P)-dependent oxidoreductase n=1 Tax=Microbacterium terrisoli TaxID=3242192 RepID=UPI0028039DE7|nr:NAD(P)-dependent oxidoreductase [Microbacterium protaetiae]